MFFAVCRDFSFSYQQLVCQFCPRVSYTIVVEDSSCCNIVGCNIVVVVVGCNRRVVEIEPTAVVVDSTEVGQSKGTDSSWGEASS